MRPNKAEKLARIERLRDRKPNEQLQHLYQDANDDVRDRHVERMWRMLYEGLPLDAQFRENFGIYFQMLLGEQRELPEFLFDNVSVARAWVAQNFGLLHLAGYDPIAYEEPDDELLHCTHMAQLRTRFATEADNDEYCYAPSELYVVLLTVVNTYRYVVSKFVASVTNE